ncbi:MAG TPA: alpha-isopropylmalate synthase regulatory domain-containing protein [Candidatus Polarisedimenticolia bacterium]|nr:alpha-isopropylmalate synthase regulatory domain-containing protein [Candidatus Polarisedimenticolia bacterium]
MAAKPGERAGDDQTLHLARWTVASGSNAQSRGAVVIASGDHQWEASAEGNGPIDALYRAVDKAVAGVLTGHPRLVSYDIHALAEGPDAEGRVRVKIAPPGGAVGERRGGEYVGTAQSTNIVAASIEAYVEALNEMLGEAHWAGATESAGNRRRARPAHGRRAEFDKKVADQDSTRWFES